MAFIVQKVCVSPRENSYKTASNCSIRHIPPTAPYRTPPL
nr:MAG TPA: hypothetical protein [Caudoviricetes sp.]